MFDKLDFILEKYRELSEKVSDPDIISNQPVWQKYMKEMGEMEPIVKEYEQYKKNKEALVVVDDENLSLAIGKKGLNVRLADRLTHYKLDIKRVLRRQFYQIHDQ